MSRDDLARAEAEHWLLFDAERHVTGCRCGFVADPGDDGWGDSVVKHLLATTTRPDVGDLRERVETAAAVLAERIDGGAWADYSEDEREDWRGHVLATLPAPVVSGEAVREALKMAHGWKGVPDSDFRAYTRFLAALGITVADAPEAGERA